MEMTNAVDILGALAHDSRLAVFRYLVQHGPQGIPVGEIARDLGLPGATLSFHLNSLKQAGLVTVHRQGRSLLYSPQFTTVGDVISFLLADCCAGQVCVPDSMCCTSDDKQEE